MELTQEIKNYIDQCILCWLATSSSEGMPNVSPKEIFTYYEKDKIIVANIASPQTVRNITQNENVCLSFIDIFIQKGFQIKGKGEIIKKTDLEFDGMEKILTKLTDGKFPFSTITKITVHGIKPIIAPKYVLYPETTEEEQTASAKKAYGVP
ncbi:MAG: pyridoxamine 5'-phosphate oxidase family protein [Bacteroidota bacterium]|nr:pyridoxamine 5'-phosphate oxidase family protein [Bacteroidota bacterium]